MRIINRYNTYLSDYQNIELLVIHINYFTPSRNETLCFKLYSILIKILTVVQFLQNEIQDAKRWVHKADGVYKRYLTKRIELVNWILQYIEKPNVCEVVDNKINETIDKINKTHSIFESDH